MQQKQIMRKITQTLLLMLLLAISNNVKGESIVDETILEANGFQISFKVICGEVLHSEIKLNTLCLGDNLCAH